MGASETIHATTIAIAGRAVLITGASGAGKSDLALRLIDRGAVLVADDYTDLLDEDGRLIASAPARIAGKLEVRGVGIVAQPYLDRAPVALAVRLDDAPERLPLPATRIIAGVVVREVVIAPFPASAPLKIELALRHLAP